MRTEIKIAFLAVMLAALSLSGIGIARADIDEQRVATAYADGYTGTDGQFHAWDHRSDAESFRAHHADKYHPWRHDDPRHQDTH